MCGIAGWLSFSRDLNNEAKTICRMVQTMMNRGPDEEGIWINGPIALGHRRLSIIDLAGGKQPMVDLVDDNNKVALIYTGEIYNFQELRAELISRGHVFNTKSDTEVVLKSYVEWGIDFVDKLNGMYAFAIWDDRIRSLFLVRDRMGVKPLYYYPTADGVLFGSEPKAILANDLAKSVVKADGLREIFEMVKTPEHGIFHGMHEIRPGQFLKIDSSGIQKFQYWKLEAIEHTDDLETTIGTTRDLLEDIVSKQIVSDVPLCSLLSGGLDSSIITSLASKKLLNGGHENIRSFSLDFVNHGSGFVSDSVRGTPDAPFVKDLVDMIGSSHKEILIDSKDMADSHLREKIIRALDLPPAFWGDMWPSLYKLFEEVKRNSTVALSGESADEVFGGYRWFHDPEAINSTTFPWLTSVTAKYFDGKTLFSNDLLKKLDLDDFVQDSYSQALAESPILSNESLVDKRMRQMSYVNLTRFVQTLLDRKDRMSMAVGLEVRVPFCDHRLVQYAFNIPWQMKSFDGREKSILRAATKDILPESISQRVKSPYPSTQDPSYEKALRQGIEAIINDSNAPVYGLLEKHNVNQLLQKNLGSSSPMYDRMGMELAIGLNSWLKQYRVSVEI
ncbi:asparagine synthase (glutamine-hydrolyzing) [Acinetobacter sp. ACIN00229]|uniref:asparagine synthase (glutamine-hydrolyzing) n=1 Tax=Acinetobacter sp. ACIN00229 TaxID=2792607 RepID=UPI0018DFD828|nr:asparagine synthase (glutamine-hydrolyzing) [Acinetobacter sp. ACIN00229]MBI0424489.1 asparagine synthase (glutamine-hydrolyzing) [Acinetobacter sp. ACIN00229]